MFEWKPLSKKQRKVFNWWNDKSPVKGANGIIADGAIRSGKTLCMSTSFVMWSMANFTDENFAICGLTHGSLKRNVMDPLKEVLVGRGYDIEEHASPRSVYAARALAKYRGSSIGRRYAEAFQIVREIEE